MALQASSSVRAIVIVAGADLLAQARRIAARFDRVAAVVAGGRRRQDSVRCGLVALPVELDIVVVHDAARPLVMADLIERTIATAAEKGAAIAAAPVVDTLKRVCDGTIVTTVEREGLWRAETPQAFVREVLVEGFERAERDGVDVTDDAMVVERMGREVGIVASERPNFKVTHPGDLAMARALVSHQRSDTGEV